jgi:solute carrier family 25 phosphate transporter 3
LFACSSYFWIKLATQQPIQLYTPEYFAACGLGGILSCGLTHTAVTPIDLVKCNAQANPEHFKNTAQGFRSIYSGALTNLGFGSGVSGLFKGWGPTLVGYSLQGLFKFGLYEFFKHYYAEAVGPEAAFKYRDLVYMGASASAEFFADIALCPFEAIKVRIQTSPQFARGLVDGLPKFIKAEGFGNLYAGIGPLWARQIPYTIIKVLHLPLPSPTVSLHLHKRLSRLGADLISIHAFRFLITTLAI